MKDWRAVQVVCSDQNNSTTADPAHHAMWCHRTSTSVGTSEVIISPSDLHGHRVVGYAPFTLHYYSSGIHTLLADALNKYKLHRHVCPQAFIWEGFTADTLQRSQQGKRTSADPTKHQARAEPQCKDSSRIISMLSVKGQAFQLHVICKSRDMLH